MRKIFTSPIIILFVAFINSSTTFAQFDPSANCFYQNPMLSSGITNFQPNTNLSIDQDGIRCSQTSFFVVVNDSIIEYYLSGNVVTPAATILTGPINGIALCNNLNGGSFSPTFYATGSATYYDGTNWMNPTSTLLVYNPGGNGNFLYYEEIGPGYSIARFDGTTFTTIYTTMSNMSITAADLSVDDQGNVWFFIGANSLYSDSIDVISPTGQLLAQYPFSFDCNNAYGSFLLNNVLYLGLGMGNPIHQNTLLPISFVNNNAIIGNPIPMPAKNYYDLASCNVGSPLTRIEERMDNDFSIHPNPLSTRSILNFNKEQLNSVLKIFDITGSEIWSTIFSGNKLIIEKGSLKEGIYVIQITDQKKNRINRKIIVE